MAFQGLEEILSRLIGLLISEDALLGKIITAELSFRNKLGLLHSLYLYRAAVQKTPASFKTLLGRLHRVEERRNMILHSNWIKSPFCGVLTRYKYTAKPGKGFVHHTEDFQPDQIETIVTEIQSVGDDLLAHFNDSFRMTKMDKILHALGSSHDAAIEASISKSARATRSR